MSAGDTRVSGGSSCEHGLFNNRKDYQECNDPEILKQEPEIHQHATEMKKKLVKTSRNGRTILEAWRLYSDPDMSNPAKRAPIAIEIPENETIHATPKQTRMTKRRKNSWLRVRAIFKHDPGYYPFCGYNKDKHNDEILNY